MTMKCNNVLIRDLSDWIGQEVVLRGWMAARRSGGKVLFLHLRDGTGICQCIVEAKEESAFAKAEKLTLESSLQIGGLVRPDARAPGGYELSVTTLAIIHQAEDYPISRKAHGVDFLMDHRHLWLRSARQTTLLRIRHTLIKACRDFFDQRGFTLVDMPILCPAAGEDSQTLFPVEYFEEKAFLAQTGQLYLETACMALGKVYCFGPTFRAEKSKTRRHLSEFWMIEPEVAFADVEEIMDLAADMICFIVREVLERHAADLERLGRSLEPLRHIQKPLARITYSEAADILRSDETRDWLMSEREKERGHLQDLIRRLADLEKARLSEKQAWKQDQLDQAIHELRGDIGDLEQSLDAGLKHIELARSFAWGKDLGGSDETIISRRFDRPVFVTDYPRAIKAFYMKVSDRDPNVVRNFDLLAPEGYGEIVGGSQREERLDVLIESMKAKGLQPEDYAWYLDLRRYGSVPHGGFGLGLERTLSWVCGLKHVRETIPFPRLMGRLVP